jgi:NAD(P)-dependent dehydrogenase (short-subunit alcohol dehydrogenase family)
MGYRFLRKDYDALVAKIEELGHDMWESGHEKGLWANQSAETWHDNFGYEQEQQHQWALSERAEGLVQMKNEAEIVERCVSEFGKLDILVNNAAYQNRQPAIEDVTEEQWDLTFKTNIYGYFHMVKAAMPHLAPGSAIVNCGSITGLQGSSELLDYSATKGAIHAFTKSLAQNLVEKRIRVNCVAPGPVWTPLNPSDNKTPEEVSQFGAKTPMGRPAQPEEIAPAFVYFASNVDSSYVTGEVLTLLGGETTAG